MKNVLAGSCHAFEVAAEEVPRKRTFNKFAFKGVDLDALLVFAEAVGRAITAWKLVLVGRFRLLNHWCDFIEKNQRHNISEDTWQQVLAFSRCVHENLEGYDSEGAWPVLIDEFVDHMYSILGPEKNTSLSCNCGETESESCLYEDPLSGLRSVPGLKRKTSKDDDENST